MRLGIYTGRNRLAAGGADTFIETIRNDIASQPTQHERVVFFEDSDSEGELFQGEVRYVNTVEQRSHSLPARAIRKALNWMPKPGKPNRLDKLLRKERIDLLWIPGPFCLEVSVPYIFTVWDLGHRVAPFFPELGNVGWTWEDREMTYEKMLYRASYVVTGNEEGKREILENYKIDAAKIRVVPFPVPESCKKEVSLPESLPGISQPFIFYPAQFWAHKNHVVLLKALRYLRDERNVNLNCYFVGSDQGNRRYVQKKIDEYNLGNQVQTLGFVDYITLRYLYKKALAMTFVSLLGPNNLPPIEAAALGCPALVSDLPGHRQQMGDAALYVNATDWRSVAKGIDTLFCDPTLRKELVAKGSALAESLNKHPYFLDILKIVDAFAPFRDCWE
jgi:glycosyltransferase involved in cell wall biosynthesis